MQAAVAREAALDALLALYSNEENRGIMAEFTERFKGRFLEIPNDVDDSVAVKGVSTNPLRRNSKQNVIVTLSGKSQRWICSLDHHCPSPNLEVKQLA